jgi:hypothetical protein
MGLPTTFQQNPCHLRNYVLLNLNWYTSEPTQLNGISQVDRDKLPLTEIEETAADMFLNWVARWTDMEDNMGRTGFEDMDWANRTELDDEQSGGAGTRRFFWMNCAMIVLFNQHSNFWESGTVSLPADCSAQFPGLPTP